MKTINPYESPRETCEPATWNAQGAFVGIVYFGLVPVTFIILALEAVAVLFIERSLGLRVVAGCALVILSAAASFWVACAPDVARGIRAPPKRMESK